MVLKIVKPRSPGQRHLIKFINKNVKTKPVLKNLIKKSYRSICFKLKNFSSIVYSLEYDPNRTSKIASLYNFETKKFLYILSPDNLKTGDIIKSGLKAQQNKIGHTLILEKISVGTCLYNLSYKPHSSAKISRSAGAYSILIDKNKNYVLVLVNSGSKLKLPLKSFATIGVVSNGLKNLAQLGKAGTLKWLNKKPIVRGVAKNPVDHPHGGGEGKKSGIRKTPWGKPIYSKK
jgi:large subunit ribosomal protein L2